MLYRNETHMGTKRDVDEPADEDVQNKSDGELTDEELATATGGTQRLFISSGDSNNDTQAPTGGDTATHEVGHWMGL